MAVNPMISAGVNGIQQGLKGFEGAAQEIAELNVADTEAHGAPGARVENTMAVAEPLIELKLYARQVQASAHVVETADEVIGFLLDVRA